MSKKTNPKRIPKTQADVDRAEEKGRIFGMEFAVHLVLWILLDKHDAPDEDVQVLNEEVKYLCESINRGYVSYADIRRALKEEHGLKVEFR